MGQKGAWPRSRDLLLNFGTPLVSPEWQKGRGHGHVTYFSYFATPPNISGTAEDKPENE